MRIERSIDVHTSPNKAYRLLSDPTNIPRYTPDIQDVTVTKITPWLVGTQMRMRTMAQQEFDAEVTEAKRGQGCTFKTATGRTISWQIQGQPGAIRLVNTIETDEELDESVLPELERRLRGLRSTLQD